LEEEVGFSWAREEGRNWAGKKEKKKAREKRAQGEGLGFVLKKEERGFNINHMRGKTKIF
jgi:hypothetical protein